jgi:hypothetical protein
MRDMLCQPTADPNSCPLVDAKPLTSDKAALIAAAAKIHAVGPDELFGACAYMAGILDGLKDRRSGIVILSNGRPDAQDVRLHDCQMNDPHIPVSAARERGKLRSWNDGRASPSASFLGKLPRPRRPTTRDRYRRPTACGSLPSSRALRGRASAVSERDFADFIRILRRHRVRFLDVDVLIATDDANTERVRAASREFVGAEPTPEALRPSRGMFRIGPPSAHVDVTTKIDGIADFERLRGERTAETLASLASPRTPSPARRRPTARAPRSRAATSTASATAHPPR